MSRNSLRRELIIPITLLFIGVSVAIAWVSMKAGTDAVQTLSQKVLVDMVTRISHATERQLDGALIALESISPDRKNLPKEQVFSDDMTSLETRLWAASGLFMDVSNYVFYGGQDGRFVGVFRIRSNFVELYWHVPGTPTRQVYSVAGPGDRLSLLRNDEYDPRVRPWYQSATATDQPVWSKIYNDYTSGEPTITLAKAVYRHDRSLLGVVGTDVTLKVLSDYLRSLELSKNSIAYIVDSDGYIVATSGAESAVRMVNGVPERKLASEMNTELISQTFSKSIAVAGKRSDATSDSIQEYELPSGIADVVVSPIGEPQGVKWTTVVAVPRSDFMSTINQGFFQSIVIAIACIAIALTIGLTIVERVVRDIRKLTAAAEKFGNGEPLPALEIKRNDEIGLLASTFIEMEYKLRFDKLTQVANRESLFSQINYLQKHAKLNPALREEFTLLFVDLDRFKYVNDTYGHHAGDQVLVIIAARLKSAIRDTDEIARYGGDEFVLLLKSNKNPIDIEAVVEKISSLVEEPIALENVLVSVGVSIGWANFPEDGVDYIKLLKIADSRMYSRKKDRKAANIHIA